MNSRQVAALVPHVLEGEQSARSGTGSTVLEGEQSARSGTGSTVLEGEQSARSGTGSTAPSHQAGRIRAGDHREAAVSSALISPP